MDNQAVNAAVDAEQPEVPLRRYRRRGEDPDAWTGTMPIITPNEVGSEPARTVRSSSWAEAAAAADAADTPDAPALVPAGSATKGTKSADVPAAPVTAPAVPAQPGRSTRTATRSAALATAPVPDFISSPGLFVREQKPKPVGGLPRCPVPDDRRRN
ncbi:hypothetical protein [Arthrobacter sp. UYCu723]